MYNIQIIILLVITFLGCAGTTEVKPLDKADQNHEADTDSVEGGPTSEIDQEEYTIYRAVLESTTLIHENTEWIIIDKRTRRSLFKITSTSKWIQNQVPGIEMDTISDYLSKNEQRYTLKDHFDLSVKVAFLSYYDYKELGLKGIKDIYPGAFGINTMSRVGFNIDKSQALILHQHYWNPYASGGDYYLLVKKNGKWKIIKRCRAWIS